MSPNQQFEQKKNIRQVSINASENLFSFFEYYDV